MAPWCMNSEKIIGKNDFPYHFKKIIVPYKILLITDVLRQTAYLVVNPVKLTTLLTSLIVRREVGPQTE